MGGFRLTGNLATDASGSPEGLPARGVARSTAGFIRSSEPLRDTSPLRGVGRPAVSARGAIEAPPGWGWGRARNRRRLDPLRVASKTAAYLRSGLHRYLSHGKRPGAALSRPAATLVQGEKCKGNVKNMLCNVKPLLREGILAQRGF
jgi:hypothetical protein